MSLKWSIAGWFALTVVGIAVAQEISPPQPQDSAAPVPAMAETSHAPSDAAPARASLGGSETAPSPSPSGSLTPPPAPPAAPPRPAVLSAKELFGSVAQPTKSQPRAIGFYSKGCLSGAEALPIDGDGWQVMRLSRNRNWGHPLLIAFLERFAHDARDLDGWHGLLVGDMSQPRGGPMLTGHASHQIGLDVDVWLTQAPDHTFSKKEREKIGAVSMVEKDQQSVDLNIWTDEHMALIKRAASYANVERVFVHPAIKKILCEYTAALRPEVDRSWLWKVRPFWGHDDHIHIRLFCPKDDPGCRPQASPLADDGCGAELTKWLKMVAHVPLPPANPAPAPVKPPTTAVPHQKPPVTLADLPPACKAVLESGQSVGIAVGTPEPSSSAAAEPADGDAP